MKRRHVLVAILATLVLAVGLGWFIWPRHTNGPLLRLKVVRHAVEQGRAVVFFRVEVADSRRIEIINVGRITVNKTDSPYEELDLTYSRPVPTPAFTFGAFTNAASLGLFRPSAEFWAPSQSSPLFDPTRGRQEFGVLAPTNAAVWRLHVKVEMEDPRSWVRFERSLVLWRLLRKRGSSVYDSAKTSWRMSVAVIGSEVVESDFITNSLTNSPVSEEFLEPQPK